MRLFAALFSLALLVVAPAMPAGAQDTPPPVKGMFLLTDYPAVTVRPGTTTTINLRLRNYALPPERFTLAVSSVPRAGPSRCSAAASRPAPRWWRPTTATTLQLRLDVPANAAMGTQNLTVIGQGSVHRAEPAGRGHARQGPAGQAYDRAGAAVAARHLEVELRVPAQGQERQRPQSRHRAGGAGAAELRDELHRAIRQPGAVFAPGRGRPVQDRQAQGAAAEHDRRQPLSGLGEGHRRGRHGRRQRRARDHRLSRSCRWPAATAC